MSAPKTELEAEFANRSRALMASGLDRKEAAEAIEQEDPDFFQTWQNEGEDEDEDEKEEDDDEDTSSRKKKKPGTGRPRAVPTDTKGKRAGAIAEWKGAIAVNLARGLSVREATRQVVRENPGLQQRYLEAFNAERRNSPAVGSGARLGAAQTEWDAAIAAKMRTGLPRNTAVRAVAKEQPQLREAMVAEANSRR
jgi:hypothetical protein